MKAIYPLVFGEMKVDRLYGNLDVDGLPNIKPEASIARVKVLLKGLGIESSTIDSYTVSSVLQEEKYFLGTLVCKDEHVVDDCIYEVCEEIIEIVCRGNVNHFM